MFQRLAIAATALLLVVPAFAGRGDDLENCRFSNGRPMGVRVCETLRQAAQARAARDEADQAARQEALVREAARRTAEQEKAERAAAEGRARREREEAAWAAQREEMNRKVAEDEARQAREAKAAATKEAAVKAACGADYKAPRIGMTIERARQCVAPLKLTAQINRPDGIMSAYQYGRTVAYVMDGRIIAWER